jgi:hypothetical protein
MVAALKTPLLAERPRQPAVILCRECDEIRLGNQLE